MAHEDDCSIWHGSLRERLWYNLSMKPTVYVETSVISYLTSRPSRDLVAAAHQELTREWWTNAREHLDLFVSAAVIREAMLGDADAAERRLAAIENIPILAETDDVIRLATEYVQALGLPVRAAADAVHIAYAVGYGIDYLATWNCTHIANAQMIRKLQDVNQSLNRQTPVIVTPESLMENDDA